MEKFEKNILSIMLILLLMVSAFGIMILSLQSQNEKSHKEILAVSNRLALVEGHIQSLDLNDERMYQYVRDLNFNNQVHTARIDWLESILITIEYVE